MAGILSAWSKFTIATIIVLMIIMCCFIYLLMFYGTHSKEFHKDSYLLILPLFFLFGFLIMGEQMKRPELDQAFDTKEDCILEGTISLIVDKSYGRVLSIKDNKIYLAERETAYLCEKVIVTSTEDLDYRIGNSIKVYGQIQKFSKAANPGQFNEVMYYQSQNIDYKIYAEHIQIVDKSYSKFHMMLYLWKRKLVKVYSTILEEKEAGALTAMLLGEKQLLDAEISQLYQENGISHILAISGLHVSLIGLSVYHLLKRLRVPVLPSTVISILFVYCYGVLTNFSVSTNRAVVMIIIMMMAGIFGKTYDMLSATALSALLILLMHPLEIFQAGFLLSFGAVLGITLFLPCFHTLSKSKNPIWNAILISTSTQIITFPVILCFFYQIPLYSIIINLILLPFTTLLTITALISGLLGLISIPLGVFSIGASNYILLLYEGVCRIGNGLPYHLITIGKPEKTNIIIYYFLLIAFLWGVKHYKKKRMLLLLPLALTVLFIPQRGEGLEITLLDVGQGEAIFMETDHGTTFLIDGGSSDVSKVGKMRILPFLKSRGVSKLDYAIITHSDSDHISGLMELMEGEEIMIKRLVLPVVHDGEEAYQNLMDLAKSHGISIFYIQAGDQITEGELNMTCLHPSADYKPSSVNAYSTVLSITYGELDLLLTGDLEEDGEKILMEEYFSETTDYDILKVAHHGSRYSTMEDFLHRIDPEYTIISCGRNNRYGHPHPELLDRLNNSNSKIFMTKDMGAIFIQTDGKTLKIKGYVKVEKP
ncbi:MAG: putative rane protein [Herbinix sp.]|nr:putative rane protein [Herbinix sp.]